MSVSKSPDPFENDCRAFAASSRLSGGEKNGLFTAMMDAMVTVADRQPNTDPRTINFEHLKSAGIAAMCRPNALNFSPSKAPTFFNVVIARSSAAVLGGES